MRDSPAAMRNSSRLNTSPFSSWMTSVLKSMGRTCDALLTPSAALREPSECVARRPNQRLLAFRVVAWIGDLAHVFEDDVVECALHFLHVADVDVLDDVVRVRVHLERAARPVEGHAADRLDQLVLVAGVALRGVDGF